jgi:hypothetical protein
MSFQRRPVTLRCNTLLHSHLHCERCFRSDHSMIVTIHQQLLKPISNNLLRACQAQRHGSSQPTTKCNHHMLLAWKGRSYTCHATYCINHDFSERHITAPLNLESDQDESVTMNQPNASHAGPTIMTTAQNHGEHRPAAVSNALSRRMVYALCRQLCA